jgi:hypothetical protein
MNGDAISRPIKINRIVLFLSLIQNGNGFLDLLPLKMSNIVEASIPW